MAKTSNTQKHQKNEQQVRFTPRQTASANMQYNQYSRNCAQSVAKNPTTELNQYKMQHSYTIKHITNAQSLGCFK
jgi:hypothetical protein